ncbi:hypothetical protein N9311_02995 [Amylibacter sp.]|nr:hypothetical protein [Amylibacter sp.]
MSEWYDSQKKPSGDFRKLLQERIDRANPRRALTAEEQKRLSNLEAIADRLKRGENVQNLQKIRILNQSGVVHGLIIYAFSFT